MEHKFIVTEADVDTRLDVYLEGKLEGSSRSLIARLIKQGNCEISKGKMKPAWKLRGDEVIKIVIPEVESLDVVKEKGDLDIIYEDDVLLVVNKSPNMVVHPAIGHIRGTLMNFVAWKAEKEQWTPGLIHRLDEDTSGVICIAKTTEALAFFQKSFKERLTTKKYCALVHGNPQADFMECSEGIGRHQKDFRKKAIRNDDSKTIKDAHSSFVVMERHTNYVVIEARPKTGRTHQIRVHLAHLGHPVLADKLYSRSEKWKCVEIGLYMKRQALHAWYLNMPHPTKGDITLIAPIPADMQKFITADIKPMVDE